MGIVYLKRSASIQKVGMLHGFNLERDRDFGTPLRRSSLICNGQITHVLGLDKVCKAAPIFVC